MQNIIEELYYGNITPCDRDIIKGGSYSHLLHLVTRNEDDLTQALTQEQQECLSDSSALGQIDNNGGIIFHRETNALSVIDIKKTAEHRFDRSAKNYGLNNINMLVFDKDKLILAFKYKTK